MKKINILWKLIAIVLVLMSGNSLLFANNNPPIINESLTAEEMQKLLASDAASDDTFGSSVSISGDYTIVGASHTDDNGSNSGSAYIYERQSNGTWSEIAKLTASDAAESNYFGSAVSISGEYAIVGAYKNIGGSGPQSGAAYIFKHQGDGSWSEMVRLTASNAARYDAFGSAVSISGERAIVGAFGKEGHFQTNKGAAYIYELQGDGSWSESILAASDAAHLDYFGGSVSIDEDRAIVGAYKKNDDHGAAYIYERQSNGHWSQIVKLTASDALRGDWFGVSVSLSGDRIVLGASGTDDNGTYSGSAYIYERQSSGSWNEIVKLSASDAAADDYFGSSVSIDGEHIIIGADESVNNGSGIGSAYTYGIGSDGNWTEVNKLIASDAASDDEFGGSVAISGKDIIISARHNDDNAENSGSAYIFGLLYHDVSVPENTTLVEEINATDIDGDTLSYTISGGADASYFSIGSISGILSFNIAPDFGTPLDANTNNLYRVDINVTDELNATSSLMLRVTITDVFEDPDGDGIDSDIDPDRDGDGLSNDDEINIYGTDPDKLDTDDDGLSDGQEINGTRTDPNKKDTDGNGIDDGDEDSDGDAILNKDDMYPQDGPTGDWDNDGTNNTNDTDDTDGLSPDQRRYDQGTRDTIIGNIIQDTQPYPVRNCGYHGNDCIQGTQDNNPKMVDYDPDTDPFLPERPLACNNTTEYWVQGTTDCVDR